MSRGLRSWAARQFPFVLPFVLLMLAWPWAIYGLWRLLPIPRWLTAILLLIASHLLIEYLGETDSNTAVVVGFGAIVPIVLCAILVRARKPKLNGHWVDEQAELVKGRIDGDLMTIENYRHTVFRSLDDYDIQFEERSFDLSQVETVDFLIVPFTFWRGIAHVFVSFGFSDGEYLSVSVEARREGVEKYSPVGGLYNMYEVIYVFGDERDVIGKRAVFENHPVHLLPMITDKATARALLESMLETTNQLAAKPQFYHTVTNTCTSNVLVHATELENRPRRYDFRLVFPGYSDGLAVETDLIEAPEGLEALREATLINERVKLAPMEDGRAWSAAMRSKAR